MSEYADAVRPFHLGEGRNVVPTIDGEIGQPILVIQGKKDRSTH